ncbi:unnamed protein product [Adineta steineri]|uniref:Uncharacterized protein n=1 Tax=Adineta steineri TaxID=433720 RepID=A0A813SY01_9BILA|nr:unnamed protein product [Adineta steineri]CAF3943354.1 unnamed protein product [Adineta steineri]
MVKFSYSILLLSVLTLVYSYPHSNNYDRFLDMYLKERSAIMDKLNHVNSNEEHIVRRQNMYPPMMPIQQYAPQMQPMCLPNIWTCGPGLPPCCPGLMCYDGNAKRGRHCLARG